MLEDDSIICSLFRTRSGNTNYLVHNFTVRITSVESLPKCLFNLGIL